MNTTTALHPAIKVSSETIRRLAESPLFTAYQDGFTAATGLELWLTDEPASAGQSQASPADCSLNAFCSLLNADSDACRLCRESHRRLTGHASDNGIAQSSTCFVGFRETAVPLRHGETTVAWLRTGGVFAKTPTAEDFKPIHEALAEHQDYSEKQIEALRDVWLSTAVVDQDRYRGMVTILAAFALQLVDLLNRILLEESQAQPEAASAARRYIDNHLEEKITLDEVAAHVGISPFHFCKVFKEATGMTLTEYVNRYRVERAKKQLMRPGTAVTEIAFDIGFQSLSQFNRSFARYVGMSPTQYRQRRAEDEVLQVA